jgi:hypothetical protein
MPKITLDVSDELAQQIAAVGERLPELLSLSLQRSPVPTQIYHYILDFLTSNPTPEQIAAFRPTPAMVERLQNLLSKNKSGNLTKSEQSELDEYERIEHLIIMLKSGNLRYLNPSHE